MWRGIIYLFLQEDESDTTIRWVLTVDWLPSPEFTWLLEGVFCYLYNSVICICVRAGNKEAGSKSTGLGQYEVFLGKEWQIIGLERKLWVTLCQSLNDLLRSFAFYFLGNRKLMPERIKTREPCKMDLTFYLQKLLLKEWQAKRFRKMQNPERSLLAILFFFFPLNDFRKDILKVSARSWGVPVALSFLFPIHIEHGLPLLQTQERFQQRTNCNSQYLMMGLFC